MKPLFPPRSVVSVYFDSVDLQMFRDSEEGILPRKKVRFRWYNDDQSFVLENKTTSIEGRYKTSTKLQENFSYEQLLHKKIFDTRYGSLQKVLKVSYNRSYYTLNNMRITFDRDIHYENLKYENRLKCSDPERVIEIKASIDCTDDFIEKLIPYPTSRFSKYSRGLLLLNL